MSLTDRRRGWKICQNNYLPRGCQNGRKPLRSGEYDVNPRTGKRYKACRLCRATPHEKPVDPLVNDAPQFRRWQVEMVQEIRRTTDERTR